MAMTFVQHNKNWVNWKKLLQNSVNGIIMRDEASPMN